MNIDNEGEASNNNDAGTVKLLGIGGKSSRTNDPTKKSGKKKTPGEIRIQKGNFQFST